MKKQWLWVFLISVMFFLLPVAEAEANSVEEAGLTEQNLPASDKNDTLFYTTVKESISGSYNYHSFNILGSDDSVTTSHNQGYSVCVGTSRESAASNVIEAENGKVYTTKDNLLVQPLFYFTQGGKFVKATYRVYNPSDVAKKVYLSVDADLGGNESNCVPVIRTATGFLMQNKYYVHIKNVAGSTDADTLWFGDYTKRKENRWNNCTVDSVEGVDSGMVFSWQDREIKPKCMREFSFLIGVSETPESVVENSEVEKEAETEQNEVIPIAVSDLEDEKARAVFGAVEGLTDDNSFAALEKGEKLWYTTKNDQSEGLINRLSFNIWGAEGDQGIQTCFANNGYRVYVGTKVNNDLLNVNDPSSINDPSNIMVSNGMVQDTGDFQVQPRITITEDGNFVRVVYRVYNPSDVAKRAYVSVDADIQIGRNDRAPITRTATGFLMQEGGTSDHQFNVHVKNAYGVMDVDNLWFGNFSQRSAGRWTNCTIDTLQGIDSGMGISWVDREIASKTYQDFSFLIGVGEAAMPMETDITLTYDENKDEEGKTWVDVLAKVTDAADRNYHVYYSVQDGEEQILPANYENVVDSLAPIDATGSQQIITGRIPVPEEWPEDSTYKVQVWVKNDRGMLSEVETIYIKKKFYLLYEPGEGSADGRAESERKDYACAGEGIILRQPEEAGIGPKEDSSQTFTGWLIEGNVYQPGDRFTMPLQSGNGIGAVALWEEGHEHTYGNPEWTWTIDNETKTATAVAAFTCTDPSCGDVQSRTAKTPEAAGGADGMITVAETSASCTVDGEIAYTAKVVFEGREYIDVKTEKVEPSGHEWSDWVTVEPSTCEKQGSERRECSVCHTEEINYLEPHGHLWDNEEHRVEPECTKDGSWAHYCKYEDCRMKMESGVIPALGHKWKVGSTEPATCVENEIVHYICERDPEHNYDEIRFQTALGHDLVHHEAQAPTCTEIGNKAYDACTRCDYSTYEEIEALGHDWDADWENDESAHWHICKRGCGSVSDEDAHRESDWIIDSEPDYETPGKRHTECMVCGRIMRTEEIPMLVKPGIVTKDEVKGNVTAPDISFNNPLEEVREKLLDEEDESRIETGENGRIYLEVTDINDTVSEKDGMQIAQKAPNAEEIYFLDLSLYKQIGDHAPVFLQDPGMDISVTLFVPEKMRAAGRAYRLIRLHDGAAEYVDGTYRAEDYTFTFTTDRFSTYALVYDKEIQPEVPVSPQTADGPAPGSGAVMLLGMLFLLLAAGMGRRFLQCGRIDPGIS